MMETFFSPLNGVDDSESYFVSSMIRLAFEVILTSLWRKNVGELSDEDYAFLWLTRFCSSL